MKNKHSKISPSSSYRWMNCPGSVALCEKIPEEKSSVFAQEGTAAHSLAEKCLANNQKPGKFLGDEIVVEGNTYTVSKEMVEAVEVYVDYALTKAGSNPLILIEKRFDLGNNVFGTCDCVIFDREKKTAYIIDFKYGKGVVVEPKNNTQLMIYALGALLELYKTSKKQCDNLDTINMIIAQPRAFHPEGPIRSWGISKQELLDWRDNTLYPAIKQTQKKDASLHSGNHCRWCRALAGCPEIIKVSCALAETDFKDPVFPDPSELTPQDIAKIMLFSGMINIWAKKVTEYAQNKMELGTQIPGFKLVAKRTNKVWIYEEDASKVLEKAIGLEQAYETKLISPSKADNALTKQGIKPQARKSILAGLWEKPDGGVTIAADSDKRPGVTAPAKVDFIKDADFLK